MELFYSSDISAGGRELDRQESGHCIKVLRHRAGDTIHIIDGCGNLYECRIVTADASATRFDILDVIEGYGSHPYRLTMAVAPPKNIDRFEWFCEKATEIGVDTIVPLVGDYSERRVFKGDRCERILVSAAKQSHKGAVPDLEPLTPVRDFLSRDFGKGVRKLICYCGEVERKVSIQEALGNESNFVIMIGPEGDFSRDEMEMALANGWTPVALGDSRLRIETAALTATAAVYLSR